VIPLYPGKAPGSESWTWKEKEMYSEIWQTQVVYNVSEPTLTVYMPPPATANGTAVIIAPGGGFQALSINSEGIDVARWLNAKGVTTFVLKYRLNHTSADDPVKEMMAADRKKRDENNAKLIPMAIADGREAVKYVRTHAAEFGIDPKRIGLMGFSAGGTVAAGTAYTYTSESRPDFVAPVYAYTGTLKESVVPSDAPPIYLVAATDDQLGLAPHSIELYNKWIAAGKPAELHMYAKGGHGFGMRRQNLPSDTWIDRFGDWLEAEGLLIKANQAAQQNKTTPQQMIQRKREAEERPT
jgi:acetyl esterase/lipase